MIRVGNIFELVGEEKKDYLKLVANKLKINKNQIQSVELLKKAIDARKKQAIKYTYTFQVVLKDTALEQKLAEKWNDVQITEPYEYEIPIIQHQKRPVVIGFGPAGIFCALVLARAGLRPIVLERGADADTRRKQIHAFQTFRELNPESNVQFGEGGAGMFSDGKLNTGIKNQRIRFVLETFCEYGAPREILFNAKPHVGTDVLYKVVKRIRKEIQDLGGEVYFNSRFSDFSYNKNNISVFYQSTDGNENTLDTSDLVLAIGHSARDTVEMLFKHNLNISPKAFSVGVRIEHSQKWLNNLQYGNAASKLPPADYKVNCIAQNGRGVYSFCMCPGGYVVPSSSVPETIVTNGMSYSDRSGENCNAALLVSVTPDDFEGNSPLSGFDLQKDIEQKAFVLGGKNYNAPAQRIGDFLGTGKPGTYSIIPTYKPGVTFCDLNELFPDYICDALKDGIIQIDRKMHGFANGDAVMTGPETRSSSPIRMLRTEHGNAVDFANIFPCGEGAGYAGGIMSSAVDGILTAEKIMKKYSD